MKKRWGLLLGIVTSWLIVSSFFYLHHRVTAKTMVVPGWHIATTGPLVQIKEIRLVNKIPKPIFSYEPNGIKFSIYNSKWIPEKLKFYLSRLVSLYSLPYDTENSWHLEVSGIYLEPDFKDSTESPKINLKIDGKNVVIKGQSNMGNPVSNGQSTMGNPQSNFTFFTTKAQGVDPNISSIEVEWQLKGDKGRKVYENKFKTDSYSIFEIKPEEYKTFDPERAARDTLRNYLKGGTLETTSTLSPELGQKLQRIGQYKDTLAIRPYTIYLGKYKGYDSVFSVKMNYMLKRTKQENFKVDGTQVFYVVEKNGVWKVLDISDYEKV